MQCCALKQRAVAVLSLYLQTASPYPRKTGMEARDLGRVRLHFLNLVSYNINTESNTVDGLSDVLLINNNRQKLLQGCGDYFFCFDIVSDCISKTKRQEKRTAFLRSFY